jgi:hypothetical protein
MAKTPNNKFPADKTGTKYSEFKNTKRIQAGKSPSGKQSGTSGTASDQNAAKKT